MSRPLIAIFTGHLLLKHIQTKETVLQKQIFKNIDLYYFRQIYYMTRITEGRRINLLNLVVLHILLLLEKCIVYKYQNIALKASKAHGCMIKWVQHYITFNSTFITLSHLGYLHAACKTFHAIIMIHLL